VCLPWSMPKLPKRSVSAVPQRLLEMRCLGACQSHRGCLILLLVAWGRYLPPGASSWFSRSKDPNPDRQRPGPPGVTHGHGGRRVGPSNLTRKNCSFRAAGPKNPFALGIVRLSHSSFSFDDVGEGGFQESFYPCSTSLYGVRSDGVGDVVVLTCQRGPVLFAVWVGPGDILATFPLKGSLTLGDNLGSVVWAFLMFLSSTRTFGDRFRLP